MKREKGFDISYKNGHTPSDNALINCEHIIQNYRALKRLAKLLLLRKGLPMKIKIWNLSKLLFYAINKTKTYTHVTFQIKVIFKNH